MRMFKVKCINFKGFEISLSFAALLLLGSSELLFMLNFLKEGGSCYTNRMSLKKRAQTH